MPYEDIYIRNFVTTTNEHVMSNQKIFSWGPNILLSNTKLRKRKKINNPDNLCF